MFLNYNQGIISLNSFRLSNSTVGELNDIKRAVMRRSDVVMSCSVERYTASSHHGELDVLIDHPIDLDSDFIVCYDLQCNEFIYVNGSLFNWERIYSID